jgi:signal-transduction protein with cAMP-binding, CBS, and nucleotidyltransferase domain
MPSTIGLHVDMLQQLIFGLQLATYRRGQQLYAEGKCTANIAVIQKGYIDIEVIRLVSFFTSVTARRCFSFYCHLFQY